MKLMLNVFVLIIMTLSVSILNGQIIPFGDTWKYNDLGAEPPVDAQGDAWTDIDFDDSGWSSGAAQLGFGDADEQTVISDPLWTAYFRKTIHFVDPSAITDLDLNLLYDDGAVIYLNGTEVWRVNMPAGAITYSTPSSGSSSDNATISTLITSSLVPGDNVVAIEIHNRSFSSSDISFDFEMGTDIQSGPAIFSFGEEWKYYDLQNEPSDIGGLGWEEIGYDDSAWASGNAQLGYGDGDETTVINNSTYTGYFRTTFDVEDASIISNVKINLIYDDGAVVYLNGVEVWRRNMPTGTISYGTLATGGDGDNAMAVETITSNLVTGSNTIAVEIHQASTTSSDLSFDLSLTISIKEDVILSAFDENWNYYDLAMEPPAQGAMTWVESGFDDNTWSSGNAELGYGDGDETTVVSNLAQTVYFRKSIDVDYAYLYDSLLLKLNYDDGAVVYINGIEVWRHNMPAGAVNYNTLASSWTENAKDSFLIESPFLQGANLIAVEMHQLSLTSSDISFDLEIEGQIAKQIPMLDLGANWDYFDNESEPLDQGSFTWRDYFYVPDANWDNGNAHLGYGDGDEATVINNLTETAYFRSTFMVDDPSLYSGADIEMIYDDGGIVYLNGTEVMRINMPADPVDYNTVTLTQSSDNEVVSATVDNIFIAGLNTIAVDIHQRSVGSSDISFDLSIAGNVNNDVAELTRGPYLQMGAEDQVTIKWQTNIAAATVLHYGDSVGNLTSSMSDLSLKMDHEVILTGLIPETVYYYEVSDANGIIKPEASDLYFKTHPVIGQEKPLTAWILGDCGTGNSDARAVRDAYYNYIGTDHTDMMLFLGDNAYSDGTQSDYQQAIFDDMYGEKMQNSIAWSCLGNHDGHSADSDTQTGPYYEIFNFPKAAEAGGMASGTEAYYSFDYGNVHFIVLDSYETDRSVGGTMYNWCLSDIQNTSAKWIVAFWHHPPYTKGSHNSDSETALVQMRERFLPILEDNGVDLILSGHSHSYERSYYLHGHYGDSDSFDPALHTVGENGDGDGKIIGGGAYRKPIAGPTEGDGTVYITTGSAGKTSSGSLDHEAMFYSVSDLGSCVLEINQDTLAVKFLRETGVVDDDFYIVKCRGTEEVENDSDSGQGSIRNKIEKACPLDTIKFNNGIINPIFLLSEITLDKPLVFEGNPPYSVIDGGGTNRIFHINAGTEIKMNLLQLQNGFSATDGGAILIDGNLILKNMLFQNNLEGGNAKSLTSKGTLKVESGGAVIVKP